jgi:hypothetical protein
MEKVNHKPRAKQIIRAVSDVFGIGLDDLIHAGRGSRAAAIARHAAMLLIKDEHALSRAHIGRMLGGIDHTSVLYGLRKAHEMAESDPAFAALVGKARELACARRAEEERRGPVMVVAATMPTPKPVSAVLPPSVAVLGEPLEAARARMPKPVRYTGRTLSLESGVNPDSPFMPGWWAANQRRFATVMMREHPERCIVRQMEAAE